MGTDNVPVWLCIHVISKIISTSQCAMFTGNIHAKAITEPVPPPTFLLFSSFWLAFKSLTHWLWDSCSWLFTQSHIDSFHSLLCHTSFSHAVKNKLITDNMVREEESVRSWTDRAEQSSSSTEQQLSDWPSAVFSYMLLSVISVSSSSDSSTASLLHLLLSPCWQEWKW